MSPLVDVGVQSLIVCLDQRPLCLNLHVFACMVDGLHGRLQAPFMRRRDVSFFKNKVVSD